jgi:hypothetical protein
VWQEGEIKLRVKLKLQQRHCVRPKTHLWPSGIKRETFFSFRSVAFRDPVLLFDFRQLAHEIPDEVVERNFIKFEYWNLHPHTHGARAYRFVITFMLYTILCLHSEPLTGLFTLLQTIRRPLQILILKAAIHLLSQSPKLRTFLPIGWP